MKKFAIIGLLIAIGFACVVLYRQHAVTGKIDSDFRQHQTGVWLRLETNMACTNTVATDGSFVELSSFIHPDRTNTYRRTGTWLAKDGNLIETIKTSTNPTEVTPHTLAGRIVRTDASGFMVQWPNSAETTWQKVIQ